MIKKLFLVLKSLNTMIFKKKKDIASDNNPPETNDDAIIDGDKILEEKKKIKLVGWSILGIVLIETIIAISCLFLLDSKVLNFPTIQY